MVRRRWVRYSGLKHDVVWQRSSMTNELPVLRGNAVLLRQFVPTDAAILEEVALDPLIPKITTVPAVYSEASALPISNDNIIV